MFLAFVVVVSDAQTGAGARVIHPLCTAEENNQGRAIVINDGLTYGGNKASFHQYESLVVTLL